MPTRLVYIPRHLLHIQLDDLPGLGIHPEPLRALLADLPLLPRAADSAQLIGPRDITLPSLAVLARRVGQGLRDYNLRLAHDPLKLHAERCKLAFLDSESLLAALEEGDQRPLHEAVLFVPHATPAVVTLLQARAARNLASFVAVETELPGVSHWRAVRHG